MTTILRIDPPLDDPFGETLERRFTHLEGCLLMRTLGIEPIFSAGMIDGEDLLGRVLLGIGYLTPTDELPPEGVNASTEIHRILLEAHDVAWPAYRDGKEVTWEHPAGQ